jgi:hypothetical protein
MRRRSQISANQAQVEQAQAAAPLTMSVGENTRKPVAAASAMPRTIDNAKSDIEAPAYPATTCARARAERRCAAPVDRSRRSKHEIVIDTAAC